MRLIPHDELGRKRCSHCHGYKSLDCFHKTKSRADGYADRCKVCRSRAKNPAEIEFRREQYEKGLRKCAACQEWRPLSDFYFIKSVGRYSSHCKECGKAKAQEFRQRTGYNRRYYAADIEAQRARVGKWRQENPEKKLAQKQQRRARIHGNGGSFTGKEWSELKRYYGHSCLSCHRAEPEIALEPDHIIPISKGGGNSIDNIQPLCHSCNARKSNKIIDYRGAI